jgi:hypothetical protein
MAVLGAGECGMFRRPACLTLILGVILVACSAGTTPTGTLPASVDPPPSQATPTLPSSSPLPVSPPAPTATPMPTRTTTPTTIPAPAKPTGVKFHEDFDCLDYQCSRAQYTQTVMWDKPHAKGVEIRVYGVTECLAQPRHPKPGSSGPCLLVHTNLPKAVRTLLATAPASDRWVSWTWKQETGCDIGPFGSDPDGPTYYAVVVAAYDGAGHSIFTIADPGHWWEPDEGDQPC